MTTAVDRRCLIVVPTFNEAETIEPFLHEVLAATADTGADVLVVDDNSPDGTGLLVRRCSEYDARVHLLSRTANEGLGAAYRHGFAWALARGYDAVVQVDADGSHPVASIPSMLAALDHHELAIGSRYVPGGLTTAWANRYVRMVLGLRAHDATSGFRAWRSSAVVDLGLLATESSGYCFQIECTWRAERARARIVELPITFTDRRAGASKMSVRVASEALSRVLRWRLRELAAHVAVNGGIGADHAV